MLWSGLTTPIKNQTMRMDKAKRFVRKPACQKSQRSLSRRSIDSDNIHDMYLKSPSSTRKEEGSKSFFESFASDVIHRTHRSRLNPENHSTKESRLITNSKTNESNQKIKIESLESEIDLKNHELGVLSSECERIRIQLENEKNRRIKIEQQRKQISKQLKETVKLLQESRIAVKKVQKEKEYLIRQIEFLEQINFDENTRELQSYREKFLADELEHLKKQIKKTKEGREEELEGQLKKIREQKYTLQSHYKAMKIANECLIKQLNRNNNNIHEIILNSEEYIKLREKYIRFLDEYKNLRNQYWTMKAQLLTPKIQLENSSIFNITSSDADISLKEKSLQALNSFHY